MIPLGCQIAITQISPVKVIINASINDILFSISIKFRQIFIINNSCFSCLIWRSLSHLSSLRLISVNSRLSLYSFTTTSCAQYHWKEIPWIKVYIYLCYWLIRRYKQNLPEMVIVTSINNALWYILQYTLRYSAILTDIQQYTCFSIYLRWLSCER